MHFFTILLKTNQYFVRFFIPSHFLTNFSIDLFRFVKSFIIVCLLQHFIMFFTHFSKAILHYLMFFKQKVYFVIHYDLIELQLDSY